jgi:RNA polymerase sigma-70 factor (ECF subfamily)
VSARIAHPTGLVGPDADPKALLTSAASGEPDAVRRLLDTAGPVVYGYVYARVGGNPDTADDITQETFVEAVRSAHSFRGDAALTSWMCTIARRRLARHYENERRQAIARAGLALVTDETEPAADEVAADRDEVIRALGRLPALHRQVLVLKYLDGLQVPDIANEIGRSRTSVQSLLQRARVALRRELEMQR